MPRAFGERLSEPAGQLGMLQHERGLQVAFAVQSRGEAEVPFEQCAGLAKEIEHGVGIHQLAFPVP